MQQHHKVNAGFIVLIFVYGAYSAWDKLSNTECLVQIKDCTVYSRLHIITTAATDNVS